VRTAVIRRVRPARLAALWVLALGALLRSPAVAQPCHGDCNGDGTVSVDELVVGVRIALGDAARDACPGLAGAEPLAIETLISAVGNALRGCPAAVELGELIAGTAAYVNGTFVWTDYAYDDRGANRDAATGGDRTSSVYAGGDATYPFEIDGGNAADLIQLQIGLQDGSLTLRAILETLVDADLPVVGVAFDTDADPSTGAAALPGGTWAVDGPLGVDVLVVLSAAGGELRRFADGQWAIEANIPTRVDTEANTLAATVLHTLVDPARSTWRAFAAVGIATASGSWLDGGAPIFDLAFVGGEPLVRWQENNQADILAGALASSRAAATIDFARVADGANEAPILPPGYHTFLYRSALRLPEGVRIDGSGRTYLGPYQPYAVYIPAGLPTPTPLAVYLHGLSQNHLGSVFLGDIDAYLGTARALSEDPFTLFPQYSRDGFDFPPATLQVHPLARGPSLFYRGIAHQDVLDVVADAARRFAVDPDRISLQGASMGGIGAYRIGALQPHRWSAIVPLIGFQSPEFLPLSANLRNVPVRQINGGADPLIDEADAIASADRLDELGYDYRFWLIAGRGHEAGGFIHDCVFHQIPALRRLANPAHVRYSVDASLDVIDATSGLELRFDSAYWLSGIRVREPAALGSVDAVSLALPRFEETITRIDALRDNIAGGADLCGPNPDVQTGETWRERGVEIVRGVPLPGLNALNAMLTNVAAAAFELTRAGIDVSRRASIAITTDGPATVTLSGLFTGQTVEVDGVVAATAGSDGQARVDLPTGSSELSVASP
jgi:hypothetical protein